ncbi:MAG: hypothetical protein EKK57_09835 [Proteobacteria bacterium]|nr:MAG: hypothetical protein EKK57_09835 [Pseudomonadota bacterium]
MNSILKFRVWDKVRNVFLDSVYCSPYLYHTSKDGDAIYNLYHIFNNNNFVIERFTGLKDINNIEIYEGDIIEVTDSDCLKFSFDIINKGEVIWDYCSFGVVLKDAGGLREFNSLYYLWEKGKIKVIGNKHGK